VRRLSMVILASMALLLVVAAPAGAAVRQPTGPRINLFFGNQSFNASTPFHIYDGFALLGTEPAIGRYSVTLTVDGAPRAYTFKTSQENPDGSLIKLWYFNFPAGMTGTHTFVSHFLVPCGASPSIPCNGLPPNTVVDAFDLTGTVTFT
jgi:hypothetical protein